MKRSATREHHEPSKIVYVNNFERIGVTFAFGFLAVCFTFPAVVSGDWNVPFLIGGLVFCGFFSFRSWRSSTVRCTGSVTRVSGLHRTLSVEQQEVAEWRVDEQIVGAFLRATLTVRYVDGREKNLRNYGIWARRGGRMEASLRAAAADLPTSNGRQRP